MTDVVKVIIRERPLTGPSDDVVIRHCDLIKNRIFVEDRPFTIGHVFDNKCSQEDIYTSIQPIVKKFLEGYSCNVMAYGQSGTGKSYTMGLQADNFENLNRGIVPRALEEILEVVQNSNNETTIEISFFEIYNEKVFDLLSDKTDEHINTKGSKFTGGVKRPLTKLIDAELILIEGNKNRRTRPTAMNTNSSRSHGIVVIYRKTKNSSSSFYLVDLAGSEGVRRTGHKGEALAEGSNINRGLLGIGNIFKALSDGSCWVPYRDTVLGSVLQDSLNVNGFSTLVICISTLKKDVSETINSLTFAQKVMNLKSNPKISQPENKKNSVPRKDESINLTNQENLETPIAMRRPIATSTAVKLRPVHRTNPMKITEAQTPVALCNRPTNVTVMNLQNSELMESPTVKQCFEAMKRTLQKRNVRLKSINFSPVKNDETFASESDSEELDSTVIPKLQPSVKEVAVPKTDSPEFMTKEECIRLVERQIANLAKAQPQQQLTHTSDKHNSHDSSKNQQPHDLPNDEMDTSKTFEFKVPDVPAVVLNIHEKRRSARIQQNIGTETNDGGRRRSSRIQQIVEDITGFANVSQRRRSVRIQQNAVKRNSVMPEPAPSPPKRRRTPNKKKAKHDNAKVQSLTKADHCKSVLNLLNKGDMKAIQVLPQIGMKTAYCIITHRSLNGNFKNFKELSRAPFWRGKAWERFEKANNLC